MSEYPWIVDILTNSSIGPDKGIERPIVARNRKYTYLTNLNFYKIVFISIFKGKVGGGVVTSKIREAPLSYGLTNLNSNISIKFC